MGAFRHPLFQFPIQLLDPCLGLAATGDVKAGANQALDVALIPHQGGEGGEPPVVLALEGEPFLIGDGGAGFDTGAIVATNGGGEIRRENVRWGLAPNAVVS